MDTLQSLPICQIMRAFYIRGIHRLSDNAITIATRTITGVKHSTVSAGIIVTFPRVNESMSYRSCNQFLANHSGY